MIAGAALCALASYRAARLVVFDTIAEPFRRRLSLWAYPGDKRHRVREWLVDLTSCPHCIGWWWSMIAAIVWLTATGWPGVWQAAVFAWAVAGLQSLLSSVSARLEV